MNIQQQTMLKELMALDFTIIELNLYLDTHTTDRKALELYNTTVQKAKILREKYEDIYGPLTARYAQSKFPWQWIESPWPWEDSRND